MDQVQSILVEDGSAKWLYVRKPWVLVIEFWLWDVDRQLWTTISSTIVPISFERLVNSMPWKPGLPEINATDNESLGQLVEGVEY